MLQNVQAIADNTRMTDDDSNEFFSHNETLKIVTCPVCQAVYLPALSEQEAAQNPFAVLEAAFLRVCHFCFRCQRPACPQCWNPVHHVCTACGEEAHLPFLSPVPSLEGLIFAPAIFPLQAQTADLPLTCMRNGRFFLSKSARPRHVQATSPLEASPHSEPLEVASLPGIQTGSISALGRPPYPPWLQEMLSHQAEDHIATPEQATTYQERYPLGDSQGKGEMHLLEGYWESSVAQELERNTTSSLVQRLEYNQVSAHVHGLERNQASAKSQELERNQVIVDARMLDHRQGNTMAQATTGGYLAHLETQFAGNNMVHRENSLPESNLTYVDGLELEENLENAVAQFARSSQENPVAQYGRDSQASGVLRAAHTGALDTTWPSWEEVAFPSQCIDSFEKRTGTLKEAIARTQRRSSAIHLVVWIENVLIVIMTALLLALILMIALAVRSAHMNALLLQLIHVDIRAEIAYLLQAI